MTRRLTAAALLPGLLLALAACETAGLGPSAPREAADITIIDTSAPLPAGLPDYDLPLGGPDTISLSVVPCADGCPVTNVLIDPDNYWQRTAVDGVTSGDGTDGLYDRIAAAFEAQGFYLFEGTLDIEGGNAATCPDYYEAGQIFYISLSREGASRRINFDAACGGSASADGAADAINTLVQMRDFMDIVSGPQASDELMGGEE
ncbi:MAG: hypothetical protein KDA53_07980 [Hyphomonas sp.]|nr:hypothetical protein [Hyphomonas sp.]